MNKLFPDILYAIIAIRFKLYDLAVTYVWCSGKKLLRQVNLEPIKMSATLTLKTVATKQRYDINWITITLAWPILVTIKKINLDRILIFVLKLELEEEKILPFF